MEEKLIAPCGMNCGLCVSYQAMENDLRKKGFNRKYCPGCIPRGENCTHMKNHCSLLANGLVRFCFQCENHPCRRLKNLDRRYRTKYQMSMIDNLNFIKKEGIENFLENERLKWQCSKCDNLICCHNGLCLKCDLEKWRANRKYRWGER